MVDEMTKLLRLQEVDGEIRQRQQALAALGPERAAAAAEAEANREAIRAATELRDERDREQRRLETDLQDADQLVAKLDAQVYEVTSKQAMEAIQKELAAAQARKSGLEDLVLEVLDQVESASAAVEEAVRIERERDEARSGEEAARVAREAELQADIERLGSERASRLPAIDAEALRNYEDARRKAWPVLARVETKSCPACRIMIPPQRQNEIRAAQKIVRCGSCHRIFYGDAVEAASRGS